MGSIDNSQTVGTVRYAVPEGDEGLEERSIFAFPAKKHLEDRQVKLHDMRTDPDFVPGAAGVDAQGFTYVSHRSCLSDDYRWFEEGVMEKEYLKETEDLLCSLLGAKKAISNNCMFRRKPANVYQDPKTVAKKGDAVDKALSALPRDKVMISASDQANSLEPAPTVHTDYSRWGLRETVKYLRKDVAEAGRAAIEAESAGVKDFPRYAAFSVWRPIKTVQRDPLALVDSRTIEPEDIAEAKHRALSGVTENGEFICASAMSVPPKDKDRHRFYWLPEQTTDEVLIIKLADSGSDHDNNVAPLCLHVSPRIQGQKDCRIERVSMLEY